MGGVTISHRICRPQSVVARRLGRYLRPARTELERLDIEIVHVTVSRSAVVAIQALASDRIVLAGDAGGFINTNNGEGITYALKSGRLAAEAMITILNSQRNDSKSEGKNGAFEEQLPAMYLHLIEAAGLLELRERKKLTQHFTTLKTCEGYVRTRADQYKSTIKYLNDQKP